MAKKPLITDNSLDALLAKGYISSEMYDQLKPQEDKDKALKKTVGEVVEDFRLAQAQMAPPTTASDATDTGRVTVGGFTRPGGAVKGPNGVITLPEQIVPSSKPPEQLQAEADEAMGVKPYTGPGSTNPYNPDFALGEDARKRALEADKKQEARPLGERLSDAAVEGVSDVGRRVLPDSVGKALFPKPEDTKKKEPTKPDTTPAPEGTLGSDKAPSISGGLGGIVAPAKPKFSAEMQALIDRLEKSYGDQKVGLGQIRDVAKAQSEEAGTLQGNIIADLEARSVVETKQQEAEREYMTAELDRLKAKAEELGSRELDPDRAWNRGLFKGNATANKIIAGIGLFFGAGGTKKGGQNPALKVIEDAIDRDIDMQKAEKVAGFRGLENQRGILAQYMKVTDDRRVAEQAAKLDYLQRSALKLDQISNKFKGPTADANYNIAAAALDEKIAEQRISLQNALEHSAKIGGSGGSAASSKAIHEDQRFIAEALEKANVPATEAALQLAEDAAKSGDTMSLLSRGALDAAQKYNPLAGAVATSAYGSIEPKALASEQYLKNVASEYKLMKTGKAATEQEAAEIAQTLFGDRSPASVARGLGIVRNLVQSKKNNIYTGSAEPGRLEQARRAGQEERIGPTKPPGNPGATK